MLGLADLVAAGYLAWGVLKGRRRGLTVELPRLIGVTLTLLTGAGLVHWSGRVLGEMNKLVGQAAGVIGWGGCVAGGFFFVRQFRRQMGQWIGKRYADDTLQKRAGMAAGFLRTFFISSMVVLFLIHTPLDFLVQDSLMGRTVVRIVQPVYHIAEKPHH
jgi:hypothetical protein